MTIQELQNLTLQFRAQLLPSLFAQLQATVQTGPFSGLKLLPEVCWGDGDTASKLLGCYEDELHSYIRRMVVEEPDLVVNLGSAEGYYAVGMALRSSKSRVVAADTDSRARDITARTADLNGVAVETVPAVDAAGLQALIESARKPFLIVDIEGAENSVLDPVLAPDLARCRILVESHDCFDAGITERLLERFELTHHTSTITARGKNPWQFRCLEKMWDLEKLILVNECRPETARWIWMEPK